MVQAGKTGITGKSQSAKPTNDHFPRALPSLRSPNTRVSPSLRFTQQPGALSVAFGKWQTRRLRPRFASPNNKNQLPSAKGARHLSRFSLLAAKVVPCLPSFVSPSPFVRWCQKFQGLQGVFIKLRFTKLPLTSPGISGPDHLTATDSRKTVNKTEQLTAINDQTNRLEIYESGKFSGAKNGNC